MIPNLLLSFISILPNLFGSFVYDARITNVQLNGIKCESSAYIQKFCLQENCLKSQKNNQGSFMPELNQRIEQTLSIQNPNLTIDYFCAINGISKSIARLERQLEFNLENPMTMTLEGRSHLDGFVAIELNIHFRCSENFYSNNCDKLCIPNERFGCESKTGNIICTENFSGKTCSFQRKMNRSSCSSFGYYKATENTDGYLEESCECLPGFHGSFCQYNRHLCKESEMLDCQNGGVCIIYNSVSKCSCPPNYTGEWCEKDVDECRFSQRYIQSLNSFEKMERINRHREQYFKMINQKLEADICSDHGACQNHENGSFSCKCLPEWSGELCQYYAVKWFDPDHQKRAINLRSNIEITFNDTGLIPKKERSMSLIPYIFYMLILLAFVFLFISIILLVRRKLNQKEAMEDTYYGINIRNPGNQLVNNPYGEIQIRPTFFGDGRNPNPVFTTRTASNGVNMTSIERNVYNLESTTRLDQSPIDTEDYYYHFTGRKDTGKNTLEKILKD